MSAVLPDWYLKSCGIDEAHPGREFICPCQYGVCQYCRFGMHGRCATVAFKPAGQPLVKYERFVEFVTTPPLAGIGADVPLLRRIVADDTEAADLLDQALQNRRGKPPILNNIRDKAPEGTSRNQALRRLRKDAPDLHADVLAGKLTAHAAMVKGGYRPPTFTVRADSAESVAATLRRKLSAEQLSELARLLSEG